MKFSVNEIRNWLKGIGEYHTASILSEESILASNPELEEDTPPIEVGNFPYGVRIGNEVTEEEIDKTVTVLNRIKDNPKFDAITHYLATDGDGTVKALKIYVDTSDIPNKYDPDVPLGGYED